MRSATRAIVLTILLAIPIHGVAEEFVACWLDVSVDPFTGAESPVTRCRLAGGEIVDYAADTSIPVPLSPAAGTDLTGDCWYLTSQSTNWVYLSLFVNGDAILGWDPDPAIPGGIAFATGRIPRCTSEPNPTSDPLAEVWEYVTSYLHPPPLPDLNPTVGEGITGLATYVGVPVPADHTAILSSAVSSLEVFIEVSAVVVDWGDGTAASFPAPASDLSGYPDGVAKHLYQIKDESGYLISVSYDWTVRWRVIGGVWTFLAVPNTTTSITYPISEIVSAITG